MNARISRSLISTIITLTIAVALFTLPLPTRAAPTTTFAVNTNLDGVFASACANNTAGECTLREAILEANATSGATINLPGLLAIQNYVLTIPPSGADDGMSGDLHINADMSIVGQQTIFRSVIIDATGMGDRIFNISGGVNVNISKVTIRHGAAAQGGGIYNAGNLTLSNSTVFSNTASSGGVFAGGGIYNPGTLTLMDSAVTDNAAPGGGGGGIVNAGTGTLILANSTVGGNTAGIAGGIRNDGSLHITNGTLSGNSACCGAGIYNDLNGTLTLDTSTVMSNTATDDGGGINNTGLLTITTSTVAGNTALVGGGIENASGLLIMGSAVISNTANGGGGIDNASLLTLVNSAVGGNTASTSGGGIYNVGTLTLDGGTVISNSASAGGGIENAAGTLTFRNSTLVSNPASAGGGGIENGGSLVASNSTLSGNTGKYGGGIYSHHAGQLTHSTLDGNSATNVSAAGGGIYQAAQYPTQTLSLASTIVADSPTGGNCVIDPTGFPLGSNGYNLSSDGTCAAYLNQTGDLNSVNPNLGPLANNGGPTLTHALPLGSPAMNHIPFGANGCGTTVTTDQRGYARVAPCDIGAFEYVLRLFLPLIFK